MITKRKKIMILFSYNFAKMSQKYSPKKCLKRKISIKKIEQSELVGLESNDAENTYSDDSDKPVSASKIPSTTYQLRSQAPKFVRKILNCYNHRLLLSLRLF